MGESEERANIVSSSVDHLSSILDLSKKLQTVNIALFEHDYDMLCFGSFQLILGQSHRRLKFIWDGKEFSLGVSVSEYGSMGAVPDWKPLKDLRFEHGARLMETIESIVREEFNLQGEL